MVDENDKKKRDIVIAGLLAAAMSVLTITIILTINYILIS